MRIRRMVVAVLGLAVGFVAPALARAEGDAKEIPLEKVPAIARDAATKAVPGSKWSKAVQLSEDGKTVYELLGKDGKGRVVELEVSPKGEVIEIETTIPLTEVPKVVLDALKAKAKDVKTTKAESVNKDGKIVAYEFEGKNAKGQAVEVVITADGSTVEIEVED